MTTALLSPLLPDLRTDSVALVLERLEEEARLQEARYALVIDHTGQIIAADRSAEALSGAALEGLAARLVPIFLASRYLSRTFRAWPVRAVLDDEWGGCMVALTILDQWLFVMAFASPRTPTEAERLTEHWQARFAPLVPQGRFQPDRLATRRVIARDSISLIFRDEPDGGGGSGQ